MDRGKKTILMYISKKREDNNTMQKFEVEITRVEKSTSFVVVEAPDRHTAASMVFNGREEYAYEDDPAISYRLNSSEPIESEDK